MRDVVAIKSIGTGAMALLKDGRLMGWGAEVVATRTYCHSYQPIEIASLGAEAPVQ